MSSSAPKPGTIESPLGIDQLTYSNWAKPDYKLPLPSLQFLFHLECDMESFRHIGPGPHGDRSTVIFKGGRFEGPKLKGEILPGGGGKTVLDVPFDFLSDVIMQYRLGDRKSSRRRPTDRPLGY